MKLQTLLATLPAGWAEMRTPPRKDAEVYGVAEDSRHVYPEYIFVARAGRESDGHRYSQAAVEAGAVLVVSERTDVPLPPGVGHAVVRDGRAAFALLSAAFFGYPSRQLAVVGVTGTDGKTTTSTLIHSILRLATGGRAGLVSTVAFELQGYLAHMVQSGCKAAVIETTSHALDQGRVFYVHFDVAVITNVTHEHLDWHGTWENYLAAKARLFQMLGATVRKPGITKTAVLNAEDRSYRYLQRIPVEQCLTYSLDPDAGTTISATDLVIDRNALAAAGAARALGVGADAIVAGLQAVERVRGRMEFVPTGTRFDVVVDFAHTPGGLEQTLRLARELVPRPGRVIAVFGSAGLRDVGKRALMGEIAGRLADLVVVTAEDPRTEDIQTIMAEIERGLLESNRRRDVDYWLMPDRAEAIAFAISMAETGDMVLTCGKAHEQSMCYGTEETPWDEYEAVRQGLAGRWQAH